MGQWRGKYLDTGPPRGPGHYAEDGRWWWDDGQDRWFRVTDQEDVLAVEAEDVGGISLAASVLTTLSSQYGNGYFRFVARARSADPRWPSYAMAGATFPATRPSLEDVPAQGAWLETQRERFQELHRQLLAEGWRPAGRGANWWSAIYRRPDLDWDTPRRLPTDPEERMMRVLVTAATKYGATTEIAQAIAETLGEHGLEATVLPPEQVEEVDGYDAVVLGSAVYAGHWLKPARELVERHAAALAGRPVWLFSSGPVGDPPKPEEDPVDVAELQGLTNARDHRVFAGKLVRKHLSFPERAIVTALRVPEGDFRDWTEIRQWAAGIADAMRSRLLT